MVSEQRVLRQHGVGHRRRLEDLLPQADERPRPGAGVDARRHHPRADPLQPARQLDVGEEPAEDRARRDDPRRQDHRVGRRSGLRGGPLAADPHVHAHELGLGPGFRELRDGRADRAVRQGGHVQWRAPGRYNAQRPAAVDRSEHRRRHDCVAGVPQGHPGRARRAGPDLGRDRDHGWLGECLRLRWAVQPRRLAAPQPGILDEDLYVHGRHCERQVHDDHADRRQPVLLSRSDFRRGIRAAEL